MIMIDHYNFQLPFLYDLKFSLFIQVNDQRVIWEDLNQRNWFVIKQKCEKFILISSCYCFCYLGGFFFFNCINKKVREIIYMWLTIVWCCKGEFLKVVYDVLIVYCWIQNLGISMRHRTLFTYTGL